MFGYYGYGFMLLCLLISGIAQMGVNSAFSRYSRIQSYRGMTASQVARMILDRNHLSHIRIEVAAGNLTDHYDPRACTVRLSQNVYNNTSVAAIGVAAHECGHAIQHAEEYKPLVLRNAIVKSTNICSNLSFILIAVGFLITAFIQAGSPISAILIDLGILAFSVTTFFQLITLPVEFNASRRALVAIESNQILSQEEQKGAKKVLKAAAMTYVAALVVSLLQLLRLIAMFRRRD